MLDRTACAQVVSEVTFESASAVAGDPIMDIVGGVGPDWYSVPQSEPLVWPVYSTQTPTSAFPEYVSAFSADFSGGLVAFEQNELDLNGNWTIELFVRFEDLNGYQTIVGREHTFGGAAFGELYIQKVHPDHWGAGDGNIFKVEYLNDAEAGTTSWLHGVTPVESQTWYHLAVTYDAEGERLTLYVNGKLDGLVRTRLPMLTSDNYWTIGRGWYAGNAGDWVTGQIDGVRFSSGVLTPQQFQIDVPDEGGGPDCLADFDGNGTRNVQDLLAFLSAFRAGCS